MCHRCVNTGRVVYGPKTLSGQTEVPCSCAYRGRSVIREAVRQYVVAHDLRYGSTTKYGQAGGIYHKGLPVNVDDLADTVMAVSPLQICFGER